MPTEKEKELLDRLRGCVFGHQWTVPAADPTESLLAIIRDIVREELEKHHCSCEGVQK